MIKASDEKYMVTVKSKFNLRIFVIFFVVLAI